MYARPLPAHVQQDLIAFLYMGRFVLWHKLLAQ